MTNISGYLLSVHDTRRARVREALKNALAVLGIAITVIAAGRADYGEERRKEHDTADLACKSAGAQWADLIDGTKKVYVCNLPRRMK